MNFTLPHIHPLQYLYWEHAHRHNENEMYMWDWSYNFPYDLPYKQQKIKVSYYHSSQIV